MDFSTWLYTFLGEKNVFLHDELVIVDSSENTNYVRVEVVAEFILNLDSNTQSDIKDKFVKIDFANGNIMDFIDFMAKGMIEMYLSGGTSIPAKAFA